MESLKKIVAASFRWVPLIALVFFCVRPVYGQGNEVSGPLSEPQKNEVQNSEEIRDPFVSFIPPKEIPAEQGPTTAQEPQEEIFDYSNLKVTGLVWGTDKAKAIINENIYSKGDVVNEAEILEINKEGILLKYKSKEYLMKRNL